MRPPPTTSLLVPVALLGLGAAVLAMIYTIDPTDSAWYPKCALYSLTGLHCPGCGGLRGTHQLLQGNIAAAMSMNALAFVMLPALAVTWMVNRVRHSRHHKAGTGPPPRLLPVWTGWGILALVVAFTILRNVPYEPFLYLAPN